MQKIVEQDFFWIISGMLFCPLCWYFIKPHFSLSMLCEFSKVSCDPLLWFCFGLGFFFLLQHQQINAAKNNSGLIDLRDIMLVYTMFNTKQFTQTSYSQALIRFTSSLDCCWEGQHGKALFFLFFSSYYPPVFIHPFHLHLDIDT